MRCVHLIKKCFKYYFFIFFLVCGCSPSSKTIARGFNNKNCAIKVLCTTAMIHDLVSFIGQEHVDSIALITNGLDPHSYELVKGDDEKFLTADLIFSNGLGLEHAGSIRQQLEKNPSTVSLGDYLLENFPETVLYLDGQKDPHFWMDVSLWSKNVPVIVEALCQKDPGHSEDFQSRGDLLLALLLEADSKLLKKMHQIDEKKRYLITSHDAFRYFTRRYLAKEGECQEEWELRCAAPEGLAPDAQLSLSDLQRLLAHIQKFQITVMFPESNVSKASLKKILSSLKNDGFQLRICPEMLYGDSMGEEGYISMVNHNADVIYNELVNQ